MKHWIACILFPLLLCSAIAMAQDNYEIQVYPSETVAPGTTMFEIHSNLTVEGTKTVVDGVQPSNHAVHETLEITHGFTDWFETGFYVFSSIQPHGGWQWVGDHIRPRVRVPESWKWPVGVSLSSEIGYVQRSFSTNTWSWELRPIVDKQMGKWYLAFNPALEGSIHGVDAGKAPGFSPAGKVGYDFTKKISGGFEYYGSMGPLTGFDSFAQQEQQFFPTIDLNLSPAWEFNFGVGVGTTRSTDHLIIKMILGRRFSWGKPRIGERQPHPPGPSRKY